MNITYQISTIVLMAIMLMSYPFSAHAQNSIVIASLFSFTGPAAKSNLPSIHGIRFAIDEINTHGGVLGMPLELLEIDNLSTPIGAKVAAEKAVIAKVTAILGSAWSSHTIQSAKIAQANGIPLISNVSTHPDITGIGDYIFRVCFNDLYQGWAMATFARDDLNLHRAVIFIDITSDYSIGLARSFITTFEGLGGKVLHKINYKRNQLNYQNLVSKAATFSPDIMFIPGHDESALILKEAQRLGLKTVFLGADGWDLDNFYAMGGSQIQNGYYSTHWAKEIDSEASRAFVKKYRKQKPIFSPEPLGYDAVYILADAIRRAGSLDRRAIRDKLAQTNTFRGVTGSITLDHSGDPLKSIVIMELQNGVPHYLKQIQSRPGVIDSLTKTPTKQ